MSADCNSIDCGGTQNDHDSTCLTMAELFAERDFDVNPYTPEEERAAAYIVEITDGQVGAGDDPIGFLLASHNWQLREIKKLREVEETFFYLAKWVERGLFDNIVTPKEALGVIAHHPGLPWTEGRWDVDHKPYAEAFYKAFPKAKSG